MKKLIVMASAVAIACSLQASQYMWGFAGDGGEIYAPGTSDYLENGTAFLFLGTVTASESDFNTSGATLLATGGYDDSNYAFGHVTTANMPTSDAVSDAGGQAYTLILVDQDGLTSLDGYEGNYYLATGTSEQGALPGATVTYYGKFLNNAAIAGNAWSEMSAVPEPTSGLLLLLGVAGLALRRKRV